MNLSSLKFFRNLRANNRQFAVIGLGRFGRAVCLTLHGMGYEVLGIDSDEDRVAQVLTDQIAAHAVQMDSTQPSALQEAGIPDFDTVIVAIGNYIQESIITTLNVKEAGVANVVAKASTEIHGKLLQRVGADHVVFPEFEMGCELARSITRPGVLDRFELDPDHSIVEVVVPQEFDGKTIVELDLRNNYGLTLMAISKENAMDKFEINPSPVTRLKAGSLMVVVGANGGIDKLPTL
ncbi:TrkA family potassium uptake protein [Leptolyngbya cf. ectocarpi LEGE 11479]|uniref:TrkA family potassium uptake protein n=1 Tax=Leptolyngbya cf. ectocarpi LEGE 11479 TaxID=1828722 RepID=A0A928ZR08_LEPEC|nr:TrkA family potassium uptake protein [Leptolyngbya ectocarpi]MBE9066820.1 TrkA family potassium uptake protein [Leptolyngbya cf. ectocarpi LEGE 11479]